MASNSVYVLTRAEKKVIMFLRQARAEARLSKNKQKCGWDKNTLYSSTMGKRHRCTLQTIKGLVGLGYLSVNPLSGGLIEVWEIPRGWAVANRTKRRETIMNFYAETGAAV